MKYFWDLNNEMFLGPKQWNIFGTQMMKYFWDQVLNLFVTKEIKYFCDHSDEILLQPKWWNIFETKMMKYFWIKMLKYFWDLTMEYFWEQNDEIFLGVFWCAATKPVPMHLWTLTNTPSLMCSLGVYLGDIYLLHVAIFAHLPKRPLEAKILF